jgi:hypothetical protein
MIFYLGDIVKDRFLLNFGRKNKTKSWEYAVQRAIDTRNHFERTEPWGNLRIEGVNIGLLRKKATR